MSVQVKAVSNHHEGQQTTFERFAVGQRLEHVLLVISFTTLAFTGLIQKFNQVSLAENLILLLGGIEMVRLIHRTFALILVAESVYHVVAVGYSFLTRRSRPTMLPTIRDIVDALQMVQYYVGLRKEPPLLDKFDFRHKFEYWSLVWGTVIMALTGFAMWFPIQTTNFLPGEVIPAAKAAHGAEAILAVLAILIWHMYGAHLNAEVFPMDKAIFTGKISAERMLHEHPLQYARIMEAAAAQAKAVPDDVLAPVTDLPAVEPSNGQKAKEKIGK